MKEEGPGPGKNREDSFFSRVGVFLMECQDSTSARAAERGFPSVSPEHLTIDRLSGYLFKI